jgi:hypothetical protein
MRQTIRELEIGGVNSRQGLALIFFWDEGGSSSVLVAGWELLLTLEVSGFAFTYFRSQQRRNHSLSQR